MKLRWASLIFASGILLGWLLRPVASAAGGMKKSDAPRATVSRERPSAEPSPASLGKRMRDAEGGDAMRIWKGLDPSERLAAMESMAAMIDEKLQNRLQSMANIMLKSWVDSDLDGALAAVRKTSNPDLREFMIRNILEHFQETAPDRVIDLEIEFMGDRKRFRTFAPQRALQAKLRAGAAGYLELMEKIPFVQGGSGTPGNFPADFDFRQVADGVSRLIKARGGLKPANFPLNFYSEWAKHDPEAAFSWWSTHPPLPHNNLGDIAAAVETGSSIRSSEWIVAKLQDDSVPRERVLRELGDASPESIPGRINAIASGMPDTASADAFLTDFMVMNASPDVGRRYSVAFALSSLSSQQARLDAVMAIRKHGGSMSLEQLTDDQFQAWGITRGQMTEILPAENKGRSATDLH